MLERKKYSNGQSIYELTDERLTFYYKNGKIKAEGWFKNNLMEGEWIFYRESGQLWQVGNFSKGVKHGSWVRFDRNDKTEYSENFDNNKLIRAKKK